ncbi:MAG TPA: response regulator [Longimicrobiales bacterium]|nr:response regulator [Longimicrobiales bacterium]
MSRMGWKDVLARAPTRARVLVVEDQPDVRQAIQRMVTRFGHTVRPAASAEEADQWLAQERFDVCTLDIELPRMSGVEFLEWVHGRDPELAVIMLTGIDVPEVAVQCLDRGARTYLVKPVDGEFLRLALRDALAVRSVLAERNDLSAAR